MPGNFSIRSRHVVLPDGPRPASLVIRDGAIAAIEPPTSGDAATLDAGDLWILPGLVDTHVHVNEPGRTDWEGFATATLAAASGGVTTLVDMPLNSVPATTTVAALEQKRVAARGKCAVDVAFWGGVVPGNALELEPMAQAGVRGFKCFLVPSGVDEFASVAESDLDQAMPVIARLDLPLLVHAELPGPIAAATRDAIDDPRRYATWLASRPPVAEVEAIRLVIRLAERHGCRVHIVHLATGQALADLRAARARGVRVTAETCPHYLYFAAEEIRDGATEFKCAPPIRNQGERDGLWAALRDGILDLVASDHSPCPPELKQTGGDFFAAWGGIASLELGLSAVWTTGRGRGVTSMDLARWMGTGPARLARLERKGAIAVGRDADLVLFDPDREWAVSAEHLHQRHQLTPYDGRRMTGRVVDVYLRGERIVANGTPTAATLGQLA